MFVPDLSPAPGKNLRSKHSRLANMTSTRRYQRSEQLSDRLACTDARFAVRLHFQEKPWDLYFCVFYTLAMAAALLTVNFGNFLAILLVLFVPGYVLIAAFFPGMGRAGQHEIDWIERIALSFGL